MNTERNMWREKRRRGTKPAEVYGRKSNKSKGRSEPEVTEEDGGKWKVS